MLIPLACLPRCGDGMKVRTSVIRDFLWERERTTGGFTGEDLTQFAAIHDVIPRGVRARVSRLLERDPSFRGLHYLGERGPDLVIEDYDWVIEALARTPLATPADLVEGLNQRRSAAGL